MDKTRNILVEMIKGLPFFDGFEDDDIRKLTTYMSLRQVPEGDVLFEEGDIGDYLFFIIEGVVEIILGGESHGNKVIASVSAGASVGEMSLIDSYERSATVRAATDLEILILTKTRFDRVIKETPDIGVKVLMGLASNISGRLRTSQGRYRDLV